jgi:hypothetical protein
MPQITDKEKTSIILNYLKNISNKTIWAEELYMALGVRRCDFWTLMPHNSKGYTATAYEIKVSRQDFKKDTYDKQRYARLYSDYFFYVTPKGLLDKSEIPDWAGLIEYDFEKQSIKHTVKAPRRDKDAPSWEIVVSIIRNSGSVRRDTDLLKDEISRLKFQNQRLSQELRKYRGF